MARKMITETIMVEWKEVTSALREAGLFIPRGAKVKLFKGTDEPVEMEEAHYFEFTTSKEERADYIKEARAAD